MFAGTSCCWGNPVLPPQRAKPPSLACCCLHVAGQSADFPLTGSTGQQDGDDGQQRAEGQQGTASCTQHGARLEGYRTVSKGIPCHPHNTSPPIPFLLSRSKKWRLCVGASPSSPSSCCSNSPLNCEPVVHSSPGPSGY